MRAGELRDKVTIQYATESAGDSYNDTAVTWAAYAEVWAKCEALAGSKRMLGNEVYPEATWRLVIRWRDDVTTEMRVKWGTRYLYPLAVLPDQMRTMLVMPCVERAA